MKTAFKLYVQKTIRRYLTVEKARLLANAYIDSQFNCTPWTWTFSNKNYMKNFFRLLITFPFIKKTLAIFGFGRFQVPYASKSRIYLVFNRNPILYDIKKGTEVFLPSVKSSRLRTYFCTFQRMFSMK